MKDLCLDRLNSNCRNRDDMKAAVIVPTLNAGPQWLDWMDALATAGIKTGDVYVVDSGSSDSTVGQAERQGYNVRQIVPGTFNHGGTRQSAVDDLADYELVVFLTQDAILCEQDSIQNILIPFDDDEVAAVCGRQLPRKNASPVEAHARIYNYSSQSSVRTIKDKTVCGLKTAFLSNSFAAYRVSRLTEVGGFPQSVIFGEDMYVATKMLMAGYKVAYAADACVYHSHAYSLWQEMKRYFDMGVFHSREPWIRQQLGGAEGEGLKFVASEAKFLLAHAIWKIPESLLRTLLRYIGFRMGLMEKRLPLWFKRSLAMNKGYFQG